MKEDEMTDESTVLNNLQTAHYGDWGLDLTSQEVHELWADIEARGRHIAELKESDKHWAGNVKVCMQLIERYESAIAELEEKQRWIPVSERLPKESGWYLAGLIGWAGGSYTGEVHFDTETGLPWRSSVRDEVYCWLDGVPELPQPPEVQE